MFQSDEEKEIKSDDKCLTLEDISADGVSKATDSSVLKDLLLLRKEFLPTLRDEHDSNTAENASLEANCGTESSCCVSDVSSLSFQNAVLDDPEYNCSSSAEPLDEQNFLGSEQCVSDVQDARDLLENLGELHENQGKDLPELVGSHEKSEDVDCMSESKLSETSENTKSHRSDDVNVCSNGSGDESMKFLSPLEAEIPNEVSDKSCCEENEFRNDVAKKNQQQAKNSPGLARRMLAEDEIALGSVARDASESPNSVCLDIDNEKNEKTQQERKLLEKDEDQIGRGIQDWNNAVEDLEKLPNDQEKRDRIAHMDAVYQKQIEALMQTQSSDDLSGPSELKTLIADVEAGNSCVECTRVLDDKMYFGMDVVQSTDEPVVGASAAELSFVSDCADGKKSSTDALQKVVELEFTDAAEYDLDGSSSVTNGKAVACRMPSVEDGLSSGHASDCDETTTSRRDPSPAKTLQLRQKMDVKNQRTSLQSFEQSTKTKENVRALVDPASDTTQRDVGLAIQDIRSAIEKSKKLKLVSLSASNEDSLLQVDERVQQPVWITRKEQAEELQRQTSNNRNELSSSPPDLNSNQKKYSTDEETDELLDKQYTQSETVGIPELSASPVNLSQNEKRQNRVREVALRDPANETVLIEGVLFRANYLGSTQLISDSQPSKGMRMMQAQEVVGRIKAPEGESQPSTEVDIFVSVEKIMVLNTDLQEIMMDHALRTISYIADIGSILVVMARRGPILDSASDGSTRHKSQTKICCHVFESDEAQLIAQSIGQAFQVSYVEFLKANGIDSPGNIRDLDYQEVLNQQEIFGEELNLFSNREMQKEIMVPKVKGEPLGVVIVESGWGSMVPTVVLANMSPNGAAARCGLLNIGDQIMSISGLSLVGLPLSTCQNYIKVARNQSVVKLVVVSCPPVVEVLIKRPDVKYQLGFSVQNGVICSLLRGGIAERGGVRVGHRIIEINGQSVVAISHERIVQMLATSVGEIQMKTMPTSIFRLLTGQDVPHYI